MWLRFALVSALFSTRPIIFIFKDIKIMQLEFYNYEDQVWFRNMEANTCEQLTEGKKDVLAYMVDKIETLYPEAYKALSKTFKELTINQSMFRHRVVQRFCKCNFANIDTTLLDVDVAGTFNFEHVSCPLRGECIYENIICHPKMATQISDSEMRVINLLYNGFQPIDIASKLFLSPYTVKNHIRNACTRLGLHSKTELIIYAKDHNLFK